MDFKAHDELVSGLDWGNATPSRVSSEQNRAIIVHNQDLTTEKGKANAVAYMVGIAAYYQNHLPSGMSQLHHWDIRGQRLDTSGQATLSNRMRTALNALGVTAEISIRFYQG
jgi:hypothetical protein